MNYINIKNVSTKLFFLSFLMIGFITACDTDELPEEGSISDATPPSAAFSITPDVDDYLTVSLTNLSISATDYVWDFGDGTTSTEKDPSVTYPSEGTYEITLTATDKLNASSTTSQSVLIEEVIIEFQPIISELSFEDDSDVVGCGDENADGRDCWRNSDLGGVIQITSSPVYDGDQAAKLPSDGSRVGYQLFTVLENTDYAVNFFYTMKESPAGTLTVSILDGEVSSPDDLAGATIASVTLNDQTDDGAYVATTLEFNSGDNAAVAIYFNNADVECRLDLFSIEEL